MTQNNIQFTLSQDPVFMYGMNKVTHSSNVNANGDYDVVKIENRGESTPAINAVDIDWNSAKIVDAVNQYKSNMPEGQQNTYFFNTGDLLNEIAVMRAQIDTLTDLVKGLYQALR